MKKTIIYLIIVLIVGGNKNTNGQGSYYGNELTLIPKQVTSSELILPTIYHINSSKKYFIAYSAKSCVFLVFNRNLELVKQFGIKGRGPKEFLWPERIFINDTTMYIWDFSKNSIFSYSVLGDFIDQIKLQVSNLQPGMFCFNRNHFYFHSLGDYPIIEINKIGKKSGQFGVFYPPYRNTNDKYFNNFRLHILAYGDKIITVNAQHATIRCYDTNGILIKEKSYEKLERFFQKIADYYNKINQESNNGLISYKRITNCALDDNRLFLLLNGTPGSKIDQILINTIMVIDVKNLNIVANLKLPGRINPSFTVKDHLCIAYNYFNASLELYEIPENIYQK